MNVDEARRHDLAGCVDDVGGISGGDGGLHGHDPTASDRHVGDAVQAPARIQDPSAFDQQVVLGCGRLRESRERGDATLV